jgi:fermentation-respiration switch protein FrsA (DUF1100 family)
MTFQTLKEVPELYRLSLEIDEDGVLQLLAESWDGDDYDFFDAIYFTRAEYFFVADFISRSGKSKYCFDNLLTDIQQVRVEVGPEEIHLSSYLCGGIKAELSGSLNLRPADWAEIAPVIADALSLAANGERG